VIKVFVNIPKWKDVKEIRTTELYMKNLYVLRKILSDIAAELFFGIFNYFSTI